MDYNQLVNKIVSDTVVNVEGYLQPEYPCIVLTHDYYDTWGDITDWGFTIESVDEELFKEYLLEHFGYEYRYIGHGSFSVAILETKTNRVIKISLGDKDTAPLFWQFCIANKEKYLPKIYAIGMVEVHTVGVKVNWAITPKYRDQMGYTLVLRDVHHSHIHGREHTYKVLSKRYFPKVHRWALVNGLTLDLHDDNVMQDKQGNWVCIDPVSIPK